jgi:hypothetical protein
MENEMSHIEIKDYKGGETMYGVLDTPMYPCRWFGGPIFRGAPTDNSPMYYHRTKEEAENKVKKLQELQKTNELRKTGDSTCVPLKTMV